MHLKLTGFKKHCTAIVLAAVMVFSVSGQILAAQVPNPPGPSSGSVGLEGTVSGAPPTSAATIVTPHNGQVFTNVPITIAGLCPKGLLVKIFSNNIFVGAEQCTNGSFSLQIDLFSGRNDLVARVYDALDQSGPDSNLVTVTFNDAQYAQFGPRVSLTSSYAERGANPGQELTWPITLSGGVGPYAISVDWGDGSGQELLSQESPGNFTIKHTYAEAGTYKVVVRASDKNGNAAFLQLVGVGNGQAAASNSSNNTVVTKTDIIWWPALVMVPIAVAAFWLGRRHELSTIRNELNKSRGELQ